MHKLRIHCSLLNILYFIMTLTVPLILHLLYAIRLSYHFQQNVIKGFSSWTRQTYKRTWHVDKRFVCCPPSYFPSFLPSPYFHGTMTKYNLAVYRPNYRGWNVTSNFHRKMTGAVYRENVVFNNNWVDHQVVDVLYYYNQVSLQRVNHYNVMPLQT